MRKINSPMLALITCLGLSLSACSQAPSDTVIKQAITEHLEKNKAWSINANDENGRKSGQSDGKEPRSRKLKLGAELKVNSVEVNQVGKFNEQEKYWPVKARVKGTYQASFLVITA